ncbi:uncharacterized protein K460DRAFT_154223 [Cucurbitaria berberidis CBS 394.84]|uniref:Uncharacterized protein n=1 Tax=Cucurbitaria berberidis CBS 394.84 TaxID=1168544 RepID=A0A9P4GET4_9PLEO|nr:uncharacterized protein K460DRAFT_154223 [Cucurbitaria berberidis CBS 394.84]KAF1843924.1 hypothetical protein K460DRAFT_154223 [Cucurbitaria berberidis CBS 394.84]
MGGDNLNCDEGHRQSPGSSLRLPGRQHQSAYRVELPTLILLEIVRRELSIWASAYLIGALGCVSLEPLSRAMNYILHRAQSKKPYTLGSSWSCTLALLVLAAFDSTITPRHHGKDAATLSTREVTRVLGRSGSVKALYQSDALELHTPDPTLNCTRLPLHLYLDTRCSHDLHPVPTINASLSVSPPTRVLC